MTHPNTDRDERVKAPEQLTKQVCPDGFIDCRAHPVSSLRKVDYIRVDQPPDATEQFEQLWAECDADLLKVDQISANYWFLRGRYYETLSDDNPATAMRDRCVNAIKSLRAIPHGAAYNNAINDAIHEVESLTLDQVEQEK